jgi:hypothetical protein
MLQLSLTVGAMVQPGLKKSNEKKEGSAPEPWSDL